MNKTFQEWSDMGYLIIKGSKSVGVDKYGHHLFSNKQIKKKSFPNLNFIDSHWDSASDENCCGGPMYGIYGNCD